MLCICPRLLPPRARRVAARSCFGTDPVSCSAHPVKRGRLIEPTNATCDSIRPERAFWTCIDDSTNLRLRTTRLRDNISMSILRASNAIPDNTEAVDLGSCEGVRLKNLSSLRRSDKSAVIMPRIYTRPPEFQAFFRLPKSYTFKIKKQKLYEKM